MSLDSYMEALTTATRLATACGMVKLWRVSRATEKGLVKVMLVKKDRGTAHS